jgi:hypothetical protein
MDVVQGVAVMILTFVGGGLGGWFGSYFKKKGENRALKEDIKGLTEAVEGVKAQFEEDAAKRQREHTIFLETFKSEQALRVLAGPERLKAHQEAFTWWRTLWDQSEDLAVIDQADKWWREHCLYLDDPGRYSFNAGLAALKGRRLLLEDVRREGSSKDYRESLERLWATFERVPYDIFKGAGLPPLAAAELPKSDDAAKAENG